MVSKLRGGLIFREFVRTTLPQSRSTSLPLGSCPIDRMSFVVFSHHIGQRLTLSIELQPAPRSSESATSCAAPLRYVMGEALAFKSSKSFRHEDLCSVILVESCGCCFDVKSPRSMATNFSDGWLSRRGIPTHAYFPSDPFSQGMGTSSTAINRLVRNHLSNPSALK